MPNTDIKGTVHQIIQGQKGVVPGELPAGTTVLMVWIGSSLSRWFLFGLSLIKGKTEPFGLQVLEK